MIFRFIILFVLLNTTLSLSAQIGYSPHFPHYLKEVVNDTLFFKGEIILKKKIAKKDSTYKQATKVSYNLQNIGEWSVLPSGNRVWRLKMTSKKASSLSVMFNKFKLPKGGMLYMYDDNKKEIIGPYTSLMNPKNGKLGTWILRSNKIWLLYVEPKDQRDKGTLSICEIIHGYNSENQLKSKKTTQLKAAQCLNNARCDVENTRINALKDHLIHSVVLINTGTYFCTGVLINTTLNNQKPYILTAKHCVNNNDPAFWSFRFNFLDDKSACSNSSIPSFSSLEVSNGAKIIAQNERSDFALLEIEGALDSSWNLVWAGWNRQIVSPEYSFSLHHPTGNTMKLAVENNILEQRTIDFSDNLTKIWAVSEKNDGWEIGVTEKGSSGSPLFNDKGQVIGQLAGGNAACVNGVTNNLDDWFGRFYVSWDSDISPLKSLNSWLDPLESNISEINMLIPNTDYSKAIIFPNPATSVLKINSPFIDYYVYDVKGKLVLSNNKEQSLEINVNTLSTGKYFLVAITPNGQKIIRQFIKN
mgnify:CR=1 FL=1